MKTRAIRAARHVERKRRRQSKSVQRRNPSKRAKQRQKRRTYDLSQKMAASKLEALMRLKTANLKPTPIAVPKRQYPLLLIDRAKIHEWTGRVLTKDEPMESAA